MPNDCPTEIHDLQCYRCGWKIYRCSRCQGCYACEHTAVYDHGSGRWHWICRDGKKRPVLQELCGCQTDEREKRQRAFLANLLWPASAPQQSWPF